MFNTLFCFRNREYIFISVFYTFEKNQTVRCLGTGHKVFTRGCGGYFFWGGYEKNPEPLRGDQNLSTIGTEKNYIL